MVKNSKRPTQQEVIDSYLGMYIAVVLFTIGTISLAWLWSSSGVSGIESTRWIHISISAPLALFVATLGAVIAGFQILVTGEKKKPIGKEAYYRKELLNYNFALVGVGYSLLLIGSIYFVMFAGLEQAGKLGQFLTPSNQVLDKDLEPIVSNTLRTEMLLFLPGFAVLGGLFFVGGALRRKRDSMEEKQSADGRVEFQSAKFWGGLWYRLGEAVLFALVMFLAINSGTVEGDFSAAWLILMALLMGMFVKPAENMINGLAIRLFESISTLLPSGQKSNDSTNNGKTANDDRDPSDKEDQQKPDDSANNGAAPDDDRDPSDKEDQQKPDDSANNGTAPDDDRDPSDKKNQQN